MIMASLSCEPTLLELCCKGDLYAELASRIFGETRARDDAKTLFLAYSYGMGKNGLARLASRVTGDPTDVSRLLDEHFFNMFSNVEQWKGSLYAVLANSGRIGTLLGNHRNRSKKGPLDACERRWAVSQVVQGTGALILKRVIQNLAQLTPEARVLLPMHDALLIEMPSLEREKLTHEIVATLTDTFVQACPGTKPAFSLEPFSGKRRSTPKTASTGRQ